MDLTRVSAQEMTHEVSNVNCWQSEPLNPQNVNCWQSEPLNPEYYGDGNFYTFC